jgi:medium-chain acyl-[acyl-carrier-protein] hydrolase
VATRLYVFPYAGGGASAARSWQARLGPQIEVRPVSLPGRDALFSKAPLTSHADALVYLHRALVPVLESPFAFYGHSMGAHLAFELARDLRRLGLPQPVHLFVSSAPAPRLGPPGPYAELPDDEFLALLKRLGGTPDEVLEHEEVLELMLPLLRADFALAESYVYGPGTPLSVPISAWGGTDDAGSEERMAAWGEETTAGFRLRMLPGGHFFAREHEETLLEGLKEDLLHSERVPAAAAPS